MKILFVEDDNLVADSLSRALRASDYIVDWVKTGAQAQLLLTTESFDLIILDLGLPELDGLEFLKQIRNKKINLPVLILTARDGYEDRIAGLDSGANDYVTKPFHLGELEARIRALLRRNLDNATSIQIGDLTFNAVSRVLRRGDEIIELTPREYAVLEILLHNLGALVTKQKMVSLLSDWDTPITYNTIDIVIHRLRKKLESYGVKLETVRGLGFIVQP